VNDIEQAEGSTSPLISSRRGQQPAAGVGARRRPRARGLLVLAILAGLVPLWSSAAGAQQPATTLPAPPETCSLLDFNEAAVTPLATTGTSTRYRLTVSGEQPWASMTVKLVQRVYIQQPDFWGIEVTGCRSGDVGLPMTAPYKVSLDFTGPLGKQGIEVIGATRSQQFVLSGRPAPPGPSAPLANTRWVLDPSSLGVPLPAGRSITANFSDTRVSGSASCNLYNADYKASGRRIRFGPIATTRIACTPDTAASEGAYLKKLAAATSFTVTRGQLLLFGQAGTLRFRSAPVAPPVTPAFVGTWRVTGYLGGTPGAIVPVIAGTVITLTFNADGNVSGRACNSYGGPWKADGTSLSIGQLISTEMFCTEPGVMPQESQYLTALASTSSWTLDGGQLTLADAQGRAVVTAVAAIR
jgi:heat shock protein HslJ